MKFKHISSLLFFNLFFGLILATNLGVFNYDIEKPISSAANSVATLALTGEISVDSEEACLNQTTGPSITFTGSDSNDNFPYTFEYTINGGEVNTISTSDSSPSVSIEAPTLEVGEFTYTLISITDSSNEIVTLDSEITITINSLPEVSFEIVSGDGACSGTPVVFSATIIGDGDFSYAWEFGDGATSTNPNPSHVYEALGCGTSVFDVTLTVTDDNGCSSSASEVVNVLREPELEFFDVGATGPFDTPFKNCNPGSYLLIVGDISPDLDCIDSYDVAWGDGTIETGITASDFPIDHTYTTSGVFNLTFTALGDNGCVATEVIEVANSTNPEGGVINPGNTENLCAPAVELEFRISGWHDNPLDTQYIIDYGDGLAPEIFSQEELVASIYFDPPLDFPIPHTYIETNCPNTPFEINFEFVTACGTTSGTIGPISLVSPPDVSFEVPEIVCVNTPVEFINTSENGFAEDCSEFAQWFWNFGDGTPIIDVFTDTPQNITHVFTTPGIYTVSLTAFNPGWSVCPPEPFTFEVCVEAPLEPLFSVTETEGCGPLTIITNNTTDESTSCEEVDYLWTVTYNPGYCGNTSIYSFINGTDETSANPQLLFEGPGIYTLTLSATNSCGTESTVQNINVKAPPTITLDPINDVCAPAEITPTYDFDICDANTQEFNWIITGGTSPTDWEFIGGTNTSSPNPIINFITPNTYTITVELTNECGTASSSQTFSLQPVPEITNTNLIQTICSGVQVDEIVFESTELGTTFSWITTATANIDGEVPSGSGGFIPAHVLTLNNDTSGCVTYSVTPFLGDCEGTTVDFVICVEPSPTFTIQPVGDSLCIDGVTPPLTVAYQDGTGTPTYQWYSSTDPSAPLPWDPITGANQATYNPPTDTSGTIYYYVVISFPGNGGCSDITSDIAEIEVTEQVFTTNDPTNEDICVGGSAQELEVEHSEAAGDVEYQWYTNTDPDAPLPWNPITGANQATYTPDPAPFNTVGTYYYYVVVDYSGTNCEPVTSGVYTINVVADPTVTIDPAGPLEYCQDAPADILTATANGGVGTEYEYQWYSSTDLDAPLPWNPISGANQATYTPLTGTVGTVYYYVEIIQPISGCANVSEPVEIIVTEGPSITTQPVGDSLCIDGVTPPLTVAYQDGTGTPTYQWYSSTDPSAPLPWDPITGANQATYNPPTDTSGTIYYYVVISFPGNGGCSDITSDIAEIEVTEQVSINNIPTNEDICVGGSAQELEVQHSEAAGDVTYQWFSNTTNTNTGGAIIPGANSATYTPDPAPFNTVGTYYYYVVVDYSGTNCEPVTSGVYTINVVPDPEVTIDPAGPLEYCQDATPDTLTATPSEGVGTIYNYQWYSNTTNTNTGGALLIGETNSTFTPPTDTVGTVYYYVEITQPISGCANVSEPVEIIVTLGPSITTQPEGDSLCVDGVTPPLTVAYQDGTGTPTYQWYSNTAPTTVGGTIIPGANQATYNPPTDTSGTIYYYVVISFPGNGGCSDITSEVAEIEVTEQVSINNIPTNEDICVGGSAQELEVQHSEAAGDVTYQWFSNTTNTNTGGAIIPGANSATYTPDPAPFNTVGTYYYYVVVDYSGTNCEPVTSGVYTINVVPDPEVTIDPAGPLEYCQDATPDTLTATPSDGVGTIYNYQWYSNTTNTNTGGALLIGETNSTFTPPTDTVGTVYYYVEITQPISGCANVSEPVEIIVTLGPSITTQPEGDSLCVDGVTPPLTVAYQDGTGTPTYQWYSNTAPTTVGGTIIPGANQATYNPPTDTSGTIYYYVVISFPGNGGCSDITSEVAEIEVTEQVSINNIPTNEDICVGGSAQELEVQHSEAAGDVTYQWFSNTTNTNTGGAIIPGANSATYTPDPAPFNTVGTYYYYVVVDYSGTNCEPVTSGVYTINVVPDPEVTIDPAGPLEYCQDATPDTLTATPSDGVGTIYNYQWYSNTTNTNTGGALLIGETNSTFTPPTDTVGTVYYYVEITQPISGCANVSEPVEIIVTLGPSITTQPEGDSLCVDGVTPPLTVAYQDGTGTPTYQWYSNTAPTTVGGTIIPGANQATYNPPTDTSGTIYYYVVISFPGNGGCSDITSEVAEIEVTEQVSINNIPTNEDICVGGSAQELEVQHSEAAGDVTYQWFSNTTNTNTGGAIIPGANSATYTPDPAPFNTVGTYYYYVVVDYSGTNCEPVTSGVYTINVVPDPEVTIDPAGPLEYCQDATPDTLTATPSDGVGTIYNYQWYSNTTNTNTGGALLIGETNSTFTPPTDTVGTVYYYVEITQPISGCANVSEPVEIIVTLGPSITTQPEGDSLCVDGVTPPLTVAYQDGTGTPTYQWYSNTAPTTVGGTIIPGANQATYNPPTDTSGTIYYYVVISFPGNGGCSDITSEIVDIIVYQIPILSDFTTTICSGETFSIDPDETNGDIVPLGTTYTWSAPIIDPVGAILGTSGETTPQNNISQTLSNPISGVIATATYTVIPNSEICPGDPFTIVVTVNPQINVEAIVTNSACFEFDNAQIEITITGGVPFTTGDPFIISWLKDGVDYSNDEDIENLEPGTYTLLITDSEGCEFTDTYIITQPEELLLGSLDVFEDITCFGFDDGQIAVTIIGGTLDYIYEWEKDGDGLVYSNDEDLTNLPPGVYVLTVTDENGCVLVLDPLEIIEPALLTITLIEKVDIDCYGFNTGSIDIEANGGRPGYTYSMDWPSRFSPEYQIQIFLICFQEHTPW